MNDCWTYLKTVSRPIVMYGTGDGGDKIFAELDRLGIPVAGVFASDGFVRKRQFHDRPVLSYADAVKTYGEDMIILLAFASGLPDVMQRFFALDARHELYAPDVPVAGGEIFNGEYYEAHREELAQVRELLADEESRLLLDDVIAYRLTGKIRYLTEHITTPHEEYRQILHPEAFRVAVDLGAYNGDTVLELLAEAPDIGRIIAFEPDEHNYTKLCFNTLKTGRVEPHLAAAWNVRDILTFRKGGGRGIRRSGGEKTVSVRGLPVDSLLDEGTVPDYIKFDVEGAEREAIAGCRRCITGYAPALKTALYHKSADLFELPLLIHRMNPDYRLYLRRNLCIPAWDLNLFAVKPRQ